MASRRFLVLKLPRTASTMLGRVLDSHPSVECVNEYLNRHQNEPPDVVVAALRTFFEVRDRDGAVPVVGQTMNPFKYKLAPKDVASARPAKLVVLLRENLLKQAVSEQLSVQRKNWASSRDMLEDTSVLQGQTANVPQLVKIVTRLRDHSEQLRRFAADVGADTMVVRFEALQEEPAATVEAVFDHLGAPPPPAGFDFTAGFTKMLSDDLRDVIANFEEIEREPALSQYL